MKNDIFGKAESYIYTIEFQKRRLPHAHILLFLIKQSKLQSPEDIDKNIKVEMPDKNQKPKLYEIVKNTMIYRSCGENRSNAPCIKNSK